jgi:hypothetical protein
LINPHLFPYYLFYATFHWGLHAVVACLEDLRGGSVVPSPQVLFTPEISSWEYFVTPETSSGQARRRAQTGRLESVASAGTVPRAQPSL